MSTILRGIVHSGRQKAGLSLAGVMPKLTTYFGASVVPGTLNVVLQRPMSLDARQCTLIWDKRLFWRAQISTVPILLYRWSGCPLHIVEVVAAVPLRKHLALRDGDGVALATDHIVDPLTIRQRLTWAAFWAGRRERYYASDAHVTWTKRYPRLFSGAMQNGPMENA